MVLLQPIQRSKTAFAAAALAILAVLTLPGTTVTAFVPTKGLTATTTTGTTTGTATTTGTTGTLCRTLPSAATSTTARKSATALLMADDEDFVAPKTFREAEILGLKRMQQGKYQEALDAFKQGLKLPGSRPDVVRTKSLPGPSPVGGSMGGFDSAPKLGLDEFELQAVHYNMACAYAQLQMSPEAVQAMDSAFSAGFDNYSTVRGDPDLDPVKDSTAFETLMEAYDPQKGFNPFGLFGGKK